jgi:uncharacterized protein
VLTLLGSEQVLEEARTNLTLKKPSAVGELDSIEPSLTLVDIPAIGPDLPPDDALVFAAAVAARARHLLTGDEKHFGKWFNRPDAAAGIRIQTVRSFFVDRFGL